MSETLTIHHEREEHPDISTPDPHQDTFSKTFLGFWIYLMTDCILFATLFISYAVLKDSTFGGVTAKEFFHLQTPFIETILLLCSSVTCGFAVLEAAKNRIKLINFWLFITFILGALFLYIEIAEFKHFVSEGNSWTKSAFLSSYFTLIGTHGLHIAVGIVWLVTLAFQLFFQGLTVDTFRRLVLFSLFWHFLDLIWIFVFTFVYLVGVL